MVNAELFHTFIKRNWCLSALVTICMALITFSLIMLFPDMPVSDAGNIADSWPQMMKDLFGDPGFSFSNINGWLELEIFHITYWMVFGILASILAANILAKEVEEKTIEILLSYPVPRSNIVISRFLAITVLLFFASLFMHFVCIGGIWFSGFQPDWGGILYVIMSGFAISLVFSGITLLLSIWTFRQTISIFITLGIMAALFLHEEVLSKLYLPLRHVVFLNPFHYYQPDNALIHHSYPYVNLIVLLIFIIVLIGTSLLFFDNRDID